MTDELYKCSSCGSSECNGYTEYLYGGEWHTEEETYAEGNESNVEAERYICGESGEPSEKNLIWSSEW